MVRLRLIRWVEKVGKEDDLKSHYGHVGCASYKPGKEIGPSGDPALQQLACRYYWEYLNTRKGAYFLGARRKVHSRGPAVV